MSLSSDYNSQFAWRSWSRIWNLLPPLRGRVLLDLGCGVGDQAAALAARGAHVIGIDANEELLDTAQSRMIATAEFRKGDLRTLPDVGIAADGIWCSFATAYFPELSPVLASWRKHIRPGGWIALTEIDNLFGHGPIEARTKAVFDAYAQDALTAKRYDFHMGQKLGRYLEQSGFKVSNALILDDKELSFDGPADQDVVEAWRNRFDRMTLLREFCGANFDQVRAEFLGCLTRADHSSLARVYCWLATR